MLLAQGVDARLRHGLGGTIAFAGYGNAGGIEHAELVLGLKMAFGRGTLEILNGGVVVGCGGAGVLSALVVSALKCRWAM